MVITTLAKGFHLKFLFIGNLLGQKLMFLDR
jgi:hypothetical protein